MGATNLARSGPAACSAEEWKARVDLAAFYRLSAQYGWTDLIYSHISARVPGEPGHFLINPFGLMFEEITASSLVKVDMDGAIVGHSDYEVWRAGFVIHSAIHGARPDVSWVVHAHTRAGMALSAIKEGLLPLSQHAMMFHGKVAYHESEGFAIDLKEREALAADLGDKQIMVLRNHGTLIVGPSVHQTFSMMWHFERAAEVQMDAMATGRELNLPPPIVPPEVARIAFPKGAAEVGAPATESHEWPALLRMLDRRDPSYRT